MIDNLILPFQLEQSNIRGRVVRLGSVMHEILESHNYPDEVSKLTGEVMVVCAMLSSMLKFDGIFTLQTKGDGAIKMLVSDMMSNGNIRACATYDTEGLQQNKPMFGGGYMAFTVDQGEHMERYQGIVELKSEGLIASVQHYFNQSEQIATGMMMAVGKVDGQWRGLGIMVQQMPEETAKYNNDQHADHEDDWRRTMVLLGSLKQDEMLNPELLAQDLLYRLYHEEGVRVFEPQPLQKSCRCSMERVRTILTGMGGHDIKDMVVDGKITMTCEFCSAHYYFNPDDLNKGV